MRSGGRGGAGRRGSGGSRRCRPGIHECDDLHCPHPRSNVTTSSRSNVTTFQRHDAGTRQRDHVITESAVSWLRNDFKVGDSEPAERAARRLQTLTFGRLFRAILSSAEAADQWEAMIPLMVKTGLPPLLA